MLTSTIKLYHNTVWLFSNLGNAYVFLLPISDFLAIPTIARSHHGQILEILLALIN